jgi:hypothetical protein
MEMLNRLFTFSVIKGVTLTKESIIFLKLYRTANKAMPPTKNKRKVITFMISKLSIPTFIIELPRIKRNTITPRRRSMSMDIFK